MTCPALKKYIKDSLKQGYHIREIRARLVQSGYSQNSIEQAIKETKHKTITPKTLAITAGILIILIIVTVLAIKIITPEPKQITISTTPLVSTVVPGGKLTFVSTLTSPTKRKTQATLYHNLINKKTNQKIASKTEQITIGQRSSTQTQITIPENAVKGEYRLITNMIHEDGKAQARFTFLVQEITGPQVPQFQEPKAEIPATCPGGCDDYNECTQDICDKGTCKHIEIIPCCGNGICEQGEDQYNCRIDCAARTKTTQQTINEAVKAAQTNPNTAGMLCNSLPSSKDADDCFNEVAVENNIPEMCESIEEDEMKDSCLMSFALKGNFNVCDKIDSPYYLKSCYALQRQKEMSRIMKEFR
jgi:hypothetical protein